MNFLKKYIKIEAKNTSDKPEILLEFFNIKFRHRLSHPLLNKHFCDFFGIKTLLIIRFDGIGDFILTCPFFKYLRNCKRFKDYKIIFIGKPEFVELAKKYDNEYIDYFISANIWKVAEKKDLMKLAKKMNVTCIINPYDSKTGNAHIERFLAKIKADTKICNFGFFANQDMSKDEKKVKKVLKNYDCIINTHANPYNVLENNRLFFEKVTGEPIDEIPNLCDVDNFENGFFTANFDYVLFSPFSMSPVRTYSKENFSKIINFVIEKYKMPVIILGSLGEKQKAEDIRNMCINPDMVHNFAGKLSINESLLFIKNAKLLIANETGTVHIAKNFKIKTLCISNGSYMSTFQPYSEPFMHYVYPDNIEEILKDNPDYGNLIYYDINNIAPEKVIKKLEEIM